MNEELEQAINWNFELLQTNIAVTRSELIFMSQTHEHRSMSRNRLAYEINKAVNGYPDYPAWLVEVEEKHGYNGLDIYSYDEYRGYIISYIMGKRYVVEDKINAYRIAYLKNAAWIQRYAPHIQLPEAGTWKNKYESLLNLEFSDNEDVTND
jgi:hypothetical protein